MLIALIALLTTPLPAFAACGTAPTSSTNDAQIRLKGAGSFSSVSGFSTPAEGDLVYDAANHIAAVCNGTSWVDMAMGSQWINSGSNIYYNGGFVGIGTTVPQMFLDVEQQGGAGRGIGNVQYSADATGPLFLTFKARGGQASPSAVLSNDVLGNFGFTAYDGTTPWSGTGSLVTASMKGIAAENWTSTAHGSAISFLATAPGTTALSEVMRIAGGGNVGIGTTAPSSALDVRNSTSGTASAVFAALDTSQSTGQYIFQELGQSISANNVGQMMFYYAGAGSASNRFGLAFNGTSELFSLTPGGNVGIGTTAPLGRLHIYGANGNATSGTPLFRLNDTNINDAFAIDNGATANDFRLIAGAHNIEFQTGANGYQMVLNTNGNVGIGTTSPAYTLQVNGSVAGTSAYNNTSDGRLKKNVEPIAYGLDTVLRLRPVGFDWIDQGQAWKKRHQLGLIAQEVEPVVPEVVTIADDKMHTRSLAYGELVPVLIKAIQELKAENDNLRAAGDDEAAQIAALRARLDALEKATH